MKALIFEGKLDNDNKDVFFELIEEMTKIEVDEGEEVRFYLDTDGGLFSYANVLIDVINNLSYIDDFVIIPLSIIASSGIFILLKTKCRKEFIYDTIGMIHLTSFDANSREVLNKMSYDSLQIQSVKKHNQLQVEYFAKLGLDEKKIKRFKKGEDVYLTREELEKLCKNAKNI